MLYCWGEGASGQLGLGKPDGDDQEQKQQPPVRFGPGPEALWRRGVRLVACGEWHTLLLHPDGGVSSCGDNTRGQLGRRLPAGRLCSSVPEQIQALEAQAVVNVSCGKEYSIAICSNGSIFSWGAGTFGQLGTGQWKDQLIPKKIDGLSPRKVIQVACGHYHTIALTKDGKVFSWGQNTYGQLGIEGGEVSSHFQPQKVSLDGIPLAQVAAGGAQSFALSLSGVVYGWGRNNVHQLGLSQSDSSERVCQPCLVAALRNLDVIYISCGAEHAAVLTQDGSIFTFGNDSAGQLGQTSSGQKRGPQKVDWIDGPVSHLACGSYHTLAYISASGKLISFGRGCSEYGAASCKQDETQSFNISALISPNEFVGVPIKQIFAGGSVSFAIAQASKDASGGSSVEALPKISQLDRAMMNEWMAAEDAESWERANREIDEIFSSPPCLAASFLKPKSALKADCCIMVDLQKARDVFYELTQKDWISNKIFLCVISDLVRAVPVNSPHQEAFSCFLLVPECLDALEKKSQQTMGRVFAEVVSKLSEHSSNILERQWLDLPVAFFDRMIQMLKKAVVCLLPFHYVTPHSQELVPVLETLQQLYEANQAAGCKVPLSNFYIKNLSKKVDPFVDFSRWLAWINQQTPSPEFSFCCFPFVFDLPSKQHLFHIASFVVQEGIKLDAHVELFSNPQNPTVVLDPFVEHPKSPVFLLKVKRQDLVAHTLHQLSQVADTSLKMELMVEFEGEPKRDPNSVVVEFFFYLFEEMIRPDYGLFMYCEQNSPMWFPANPSADLRNYYLFGILYGLCLFNRVLAYVPFPLALFKKLRGKEPSLQDLKELSPVLGNSLQSVLDYELDDMEANLQLSYNIIWDNVAVDLIPNGHIVAVNTTNRKDFVSRYVDYVFSKSVERVFYAFERGLYKVLDERVVDFFAPEELMEVATGEANYDWDMFEKNTAYWGIYNMVHPTIKMFWQVFRGLTLADKKSFLLFVSGSDRLPVKPKEDMHLKIHSREGLSEDHLPEAQTCCQILLLPPYSTIEKLKEKLFLAIENNRGFGKP
ncbi:probable E3 ubiquitin-protein ligase HERC6 [Heteronotia binoei]|uniref:probable E3 ubiquitin-protein ligase HERC6 n=1 Tax=Heteronotia binoei TaxID=13085 RepID=UPI00292D5582|nr:probable E3 ubiquitin-protein ligase HERC6 [Heteronotia binoei]